MIDAIFFNFQVISQEALFKSTAGLQSLRVLLTAFVDIPSVKHFLWGQVLMLVEPLSS